MTEQDFRTLLRTLPPGYCYTATGQEAADGSAWLLEQEAIVTEDGRLVAQLLHSPPRPAVPGCAGILGGMNAC